MTGFWSTVGSAARATLLRHRAPEAVPLAPSPHGTVFVLSGGSALGAAQAGMLRGLLEAGIVPDALVGCSVGALNAAFLAQDPTVDGAARLEQLWRGMQSRDIFPGSSATKLLNLLRRADHLCSADGLRTLITEQMHVADLADAGVPVHVVTTDLRSGRPVFHTAGDPVRILSASASLPGIFPPVSIDGELHVDGGVTALVPVGYALGLNPERVFVLDVASTAEFPVRSRLTVFDVVAAGFAVAIRAQADSLAAAEADERVHVISAPIPGRARIGGVMDFSHTAELLEAGYAAGQAAAARAHSRTFAQADAHTPTPHAA